MAKKQSNMGAFERAGYASGQAKAPSAGFDYLKGIAGKMQNISKIDSAIQKTKDLMNKNPNGVEIPKLTDGANEQVTNYLKEKKPLIAEAHEKMRNGTDEEKDEATKFLNDMEKGIAQLNSDYENAALKQDEYLAMQKKGSYAVSNNEEQKLNFHNFANGTYASQGTIKEDENGMPRLTYGDQVWDAVDVGGEYNPGLEDSIDDILTSVEDLGIDGGDWNRNATKRQLEKAARDNPEGVKDYMYQNPELINTFIANQYGIAQNIEVNSETPGAYKTKNKKGKTVWMVE
mgnify:CR=1 FL=1